MDEIEKLKCTVPGCKNNWSVKIEAPKCSFHQWGSVKDLNDKKVKQETPRFDQPADTEAWWQK